MSSVSDICKSIDLRLETDIGSRPTPIILLGVGLDLTGGVGDKLLIGLM